MSQQPINRVCFSFIRWNEIEGYYEMVTWVKENGRFINSGKSKVKPDKIQRKELAESKYNEIMLESISF